MKSNITFFLCLFLVVGHMLAQKQYVIDQPVKEISHLQHVSSSRLAFQPELAPFLHGVASGDPLQDRVIIWTRVTPDSLTGSGNLDISWRIATDTALVNVVNSGTVTTDSSRDYTVKVDVDGLASNTTYYYGFTIGGKNSLTGRTKTAPNIGEADHLRFGVVSCSNYEAGFFNAYGRIAERNDIDAVIHLGDYIYEYATRVYGDSSLENRNHQAFETVTLEQYRARYSLYRLDPDLRSVHQQQPFICIWDDHESANDAYVDGAQNHDPETQGEWEQRKAVAKQAYFEWIPIRDNDEQNIFRTFSYGEVADLIMLDTRLEGREMQIDSVGNPALLDENRTMLGTEQLDWFFNALDSADASWKIIGNQVMFSEFYVGWASVADPTLGTPDEFESIFLDIWDGYPAERLRIIEYLEESNIDNVVFITGDFHSAFAYDVADSVVDESLFWAPKENYNSQTGEGSVAVEFVTPSINSANFDENLGQLASDGFEFQINRPLPLINNVPNPHMKYSDLDQHGYFILDVKADSIKANWYFVDRIDSVSSQESFQAAMLALAGNNHLDSTILESEGKLEQQLPAPSDPPQLSTSLRPVASTIFAIMGVYPNPSSQSSLIQYALNKPQQVSIDIFDIQGRKIKSLTNSYQASGIHEVSFRTEDLAAGVYQLIFNVGNSFDSRKLVIN